MKTFGFITVITLSKKHIYNNKLTSFQAKKCEVTDVAVLIIVDPLKTLASALKERFPDLK